MSETVRSPAAPPGHPCEYAAGARLARPRGGRVTIEETLAPVADGLAAAESRLLEAAGEESPIVAEAIGHVVGAGGKRLRPACLLLAAGLGPDGRADAVIRSSTWASKPRLPRCSCTASATAGPWQPAHTAGSVCCWR